MKMARMVKLDKRMQKILMISKIKEINQLSCPLGRQKKMKEMTEKEFVRIAISLNRLQRIHTVCAAHAISVSKKSSTKNRKSALLVYLKTQKLSKKNLNNREKKVLLKKK